jgi:hypothetical protein
MHESEEAIEFFKMRALIIQLNVENKYNNTFTHETDRVRSKLDGKLWAMKVLRPIEDFADVLERETESPMVYEDIVSNRGYNTLHTYKHCILSAILTNIHTRGVSLCTKIVLGGIV